jgi:flotillin
MLMILIGTALCVIPWLPMPGVELPMPTKALLFVSGTVLLIVGAVCLVVTRLYRKASASMAFVRTGQGNAKVIRDGGTIVIPVLHQVIPVSLETMP